MEDDAVLDQMLTSFAGHLIPEAFMAPTRAQRVWLETAGPAPARGASARARFDQWVDERIEDALDAWWPHGRPRIVAFTSDGYLLRRYDEPGCDHLECVVGLVQRDVADIYEPWVFGASLPRPQQWWELQEDEHGNEVEVLRSPTTDRWMAIWYAEARGGGVADTYAGYLCLDGEEVTTAGAMDVRTTLTSRGFHRMLYSHPSRRLHPLRRR